jgi:hypothetical protein
LRPCQGGSDGGGGATVVVVGRSSAVHVVVTVSPYSSAGVGVRAQAASTTSTAHPQPARPIAASDTRPVGRVQAAARTVE